MKFDKFTLTPGTKRIQVQFWKEFRDEDEAKIVFERYVDAVTVGGLEISTDHRVTIEGESTRDHTAEFSRRRDRTASDQPAKETVLEIEPEQRGGPDATVGIEQI